MSMKFSVTWGADRSETDGDTVDVECAVGLSGRDLDELRNELATGQQLRVESGSVGKGASGPGVAVILDVAEHVINDAAGLLAIGEALRRIIRRTSERRGRSPSILDADALGAVATTYVTDHLDDVGQPWVVPLNVSPGVGTDERDVWAAAFDDLSGGQLHVVFLSPSGLGLGYVRVPIEAFIDDSGTYRFRTAEDVAHWWRRA